MTVETSETKFVHFTAGGAHHSFYVEITEAIHAEIFTDVFHRHLIGDQFFWIGEVDTVVAGEPMRRTTHAHVHFLCAGLAQVDHARARGRAADDRVVDDHNAFPGDQFLDQVQFHPHIEIADELARLQKRAADVVVAHKSVCKRNL